MGDIMEAMSVILTFCGVNMRHAHYKDLPKYASPRKKITFVSAAAPATICHMLLFFCAGSSSSPIGI